MPTVAEVACDFTAMLLAGEFRAAGERFWAADVRSLDPSGPAMAANGIEAVRAKVVLKSAAFGIEDLSIDGPFVTGDCFALFMDMVLIDRRTAARAPHSQIAVFTVNDGRISEERYFHA